jgi:hypothetical protein
MGMATMGGANRWCPRTALIPPLFLVICFETGYVIHKQRSVRYLGINFDVSHGQPQGTMRPLRDSPHPPTPRRANGSTPLYAPGS